MGGTKEVLTLFFVLMVKTWPQIRPFTPALPFIAKFFCLSLYFVLVNSLLGWRSSNGLISVGPRSGCVGEDLGGWEGGLRYLTS